MPNSLEVRGCKSRGCECGSLKITRQTQGPYNVTSLGGEGFSHQGTCFGSTKHAQRSQGQSRVSRQRDLNI